MREEAAKVAETFAEDIHYEEAGAQDVADAIRALAAPEEKPLSSLQTHGRGTIKQGGR